VRLARRSLALRPAHSRRHLYVTRYTEGFSHFVTSMTAPVLPAGAFAGWGSHPLESAAFSRRTQKAVVLGGTGDGSLDPHGRFPSVGQEASASAFWS